MKKFFPFLILILHVSISLEAAYLRNVPQTIVQPDGAIIHCFAEGDEFHRWLYDSNGYSIVLNTETGYFTFADVIDDVLVPTKYIVGKNIYPENIQPNVNISAEAWLNKRNSRNINIPVRAKNTGILNNIVIFLRFSDDTQFNTEFAIYEQMFNDENENANSMKNYYWQTSYKKFTINTTFYPEPQNGNIFSYQDNYPRNYYRKYSPTNPQGYTESQKQSRLQTLLRNAVLAIRNEIPSDLDVDFDGDGKVDNICFIVKGDTEAWSDLLWPQMNTFEDAYYVSINNKRCYTYNFQMENHTLYNVGVLCHEMFHSLGAPDLYHYPPSGNYTVGEWDIMELTTEPPQSMGAYMKFKYGKWIDEIPVIETVGFYEVNPLQSGDNNICYKIPVPETNQEYILVEYRLKSGVFEGALPSSGLLIYRIWPHTNGNTNPMISDEVYLFRPGGGYENNWDKSAFSYQNGRTNFHKNITDPACVLTNMNFGSVGIHHIHQTENKTIRFYVAYENAPYLFMKDELIYMASSSNASKTIDVHTNMSNYDITTTAEWLSISKNETENKITFTTVSSNSTTSNRTAFITLSGEDFVQTIKVIQYAGQTTLSVTPRTQTVDGVKGSSAEYSVSTSYFDWNATTTADWVDLDIDLDNNILTATATSNNPYPAERQAIIRVTSGTAQANVIFVQTIMSSINNEELKSIRIYPNPTTGQLRVESGEWRIENVEIFDMFGSHLMSVKPLDFFDSQKITIDIWFLPKGVYFLRFNNQTIKVVKL